MISQSKDLSYLVDFVNKTVKKSEIMATGTNCSAAPNLPLAKQLYIHTGNIVNWNRLKRVASSLSATSELSECMKCTIQSWMDDLTDQDRSNLEKQTEVTCCNSKNLEPLPATERNDYKITVKVFVEASNKAAIHEAVNKVFRDLSIEAVETVILSVPDDQRDITHLREAWSALEKEVDDNRVYSLGISDLNKNQLQQLYQEAKIKPCINQVNMTTCCVIPQELSEFSKEHDVQLLTHNDPPVILSPEDCEEVISGVLPSSGVEGPWTPQWVARYSVLIKARGVIKTKGFSVAASRNIIKT